MSGPAAGRGKPSPAGSRKPSPAGPRFSVRLFLAFRGMRRWSLALPLALLAAGTVLLARGGQLQAGLAREKGEPCELTAELSGSLSEEAFQTAQGLPGVEAASLLWQLPGTLVYGEYQASVTLWGLDSGCLSGSWLQGGAYPESSAMAYLVLNQAALKAFQDERQLPLEAPEAVDWQAAALALGSGAGGGMSGSGTSGSGTSGSGAAGGSGGTPVRVCGVLEDGLEEPRAYLSGEQARELLAAQGSPETQPVLWLRLENAGVRGQAAEGLAVLGLSAEGEDAREADWAVREERRNLYLGAGAAILLCGLLVFGYQERLEREKEALAWAALERAGDPARWLRQAACCRWGLLLAAGAALGGAAAWLSGTS